MKEKKLRLSIKQQLNPLNKLVVLIPWFFPQKKTCLDDINL